MGREPEHHNLSALFTESMFCIFNDAGPFLFNEFEISGDSIYPDVKGLPFRIFTERVCFFDIDEIVFIFSSLTLRS